MIRSKIFLVAACLCLLQGCTTNDFEIKHYKRKSDSNGLFTNGNQPDHIRTKPSRLSGPDRLDESGNQPDTIVGITFTHNKTD